MNDQKEPKNLKNIKVVLMGDSGVGKTSIVNRYIKDTFENNLLSTAGVCFFLKIIEIWRYKWNLQIRCNNKFL